MAIQEIVVPDIGGAEGAEVIELLVAPGDDIALDQSLIVLESDKASMEIPATCAGKLVELLVKEGDELSEGAVIAKVEASEGAAIETPVISEAPAASASPAAAEQAVAETVAPAQKAVANEPVSSVSAPASETPATTVAAAAEPAASGVYAGPAVRKLAREFGVSLSQVSGTGPSGRILKEDLHRFVSDSLQGSGASAASAAGSGIPPVPEVDFSKFGEVEVTQRSKLDKLTATNMHRSWLNVPHVTQFDDVDITDLEAFRSELKAEGERRGVRLTPVPFILKACAVALRDNPRINASLARGGEDLVYKHYVHIGMAVDTPAGLMVPVIRDVDRKSIWELAAEVFELAAKARDRKLKPQEMQGGCFTVSSLGAIGGTGFTPIVNTPEVAILGVSKASMKPVWDGAEFEPRKMLPLALSYDHRVVNGGDGGRFLSRVVELLGDIRRLAL